VENPGRILQCDIQRYHHTRPYENNEQVELKSEPILFKENWAYNYYYRSLKIA